MGYFFPPLQLTPSKVPLAQSISDGWCQVSHMGHLLAVDLNCVGTEQL
jgi:hypothetical protein